MLGALDSVGVSLLLELLNGPRTEAELLAAVGEATQPTGNRRLHRLKDVGLVSQQAGTRRGPGRPWSLAQPAETEVWLAALFALSDAIERDDSARRASASREVRRARAKRVGHRDASRQPRR